MLSDSEAFGIVEDVLRDDGTLAEFEAETGKILGRVMITIGNAPTDLDLDIPEGSKAFICSFDFYDCEIGIAFDPMHKKVKSGLWITQQKDGAEPPEQAWVAFFIEKLTGSIEEDGSYGIPIYSFVNDTADLTVAPTRATS
ncbi:MAG: hypothetical protein SOY67_03580 [Collinsella sp.]|nr:hypothetical protein [Collinsella sp.]